MTCPCGAVSRIEFNVLFRCRVICPACGRRTGWHDRPLPAEMEFERNYHEDTQFIDRKYQARKGCDD